MEKKTINKLNPSFMQSINIAEKFCKEWEDELVSDEVLADRIAELVDTRNGIRGFFAYALSDVNCTLLDKLPSALLFKLREKGEPIVCLVVKNFIMSSAQVINHRRDKNAIYENISKNISERCLDLLRKLDTKLVTKEINEVIYNLNKMGNGFNSSIRYDDEQKKFIKERIKKLSN
ncbi:MAG: hypothetical protein CMK49_01240 [Prochlorococcus sp. SP3034]|nr:hypothetical protein [Prochlorococcus sp. SP3034]|tara:strand:+ start:56 stop:583 length:528 start_codon:yes stop_codon:yes gene_type:complete